MAFRMICVTLLLAGLPITGCGTVANVVTSRPEEGGKTPFGGVRHDENCIKTAADGKFGLLPHPESESEQHAQVVRMLVFAADLPFSFVGDLVTWPYTATYSFINQPVPVPPVTEATNILPPTYVKPEPPGQSKQKDGKPAQLPLPAPKELIP